MTCRYAEIAGKDGVKHILTTDAGQRTCGGRASHRSVEQILVVGPTGGHYGQTVRAKREHSRQTRDRLAPHSEFTPLADGRDRRGEPAEHNSPCWICLNA